MSKTSKIILGDQIGKIGKVVGSVLEGEQMYSAVPGLKLKPRGCSNSSHIGIGEVS